MQRYKKEHTHVIAFDTRFHEDLHPFTDNRLIIRAEKVGAIRSA